MNAAALRASPVLRASHARTPLIKFLGKRSFPAEADHAQRPHPMAPQGVIPSSFQEYRKTAQQHGPLKTGAAAGAAAVGAVFSRSQLPSQYHYITMSAEEAEAIESGGASFVI
ncbi:hypothetical protein PYCC9005_003303 [Savitreella phatthalungensis]